MWITQTYLCSAEPNAKVHIYYMFEDYVRTQKHLTEKIQAVLENMGDRYGNEVSLYMPNPSAANKIESQVREIKPLWSMLKGKLPGLLISTKPMKDFDFEEGDHFFIAFDQVSEADPEHFAETISGVKEMTEGFLKDWKPRELVPGEPTFGNLWDRFVEAVEIKPGLFGFKIDLKSLMMRRR